MARRKKRRRSRKFTIPLAPVMGLTAGLAEPVANMVLKGEWETSLNHLGAIYTGYNAMEGKFDFGMLSKGLLPLVAGMLVHKFVGGTLGVNRMLAQANVPVIRL